MKIKILIFCFCSFNSFSASAQSLDKKELESLQIIIMNFLQSQDNNTQGQRKSEFIYCLMDVDSIGKINGVHLLSDNSNIDSTYSYLNRLTPTIFQNWEAKSCKRKMIIIPIISLSQSNLPSYVGDVKKAYSIKQYLIETITIMKETNGLILTSALQYNSPIQKQ